MSSELAYEADTSNVLINPPRLLLGATVAAAFVSFGLLFLDSTIGYGVAVFASLLGGFTTLKDLKRRGNSNYRHLDWFRPGLRIVKFIVLAIAIAHVAILANNAANGGSLF